MPNQNHRHLEEDIAEELWGNGVAAQFLSVQLPGRNAEQWELWLRNNRNQSRRAPYRIEFERISNGTYYRQSELAKFIEWEESRQLGTMKLTGRSAEVMRAYGIGTSNGSTTGRKLEIVGINRQFDQSSDQAYVQVITGDPLMVYRLPLEQARDVAEKLIAAADESGPSASVSSQI
jgi:hypothetical protein